MKPEGEPEGFKPEEPEGTGKNDLTVYNQPDSLEIFKPEGLNRKNTALRFVSPCFCETVEPEKTPPYGGAYLPSGLTGEDAPHHIEEDENAEYF